MAEERTHRGRAPATRPWRSAWLAVATNRRWAGVAAGFLAGVLVAAVVPRVAPLLDGENRLEPGDLVILSGRDEGFGGQREALVNQWNATVGRRHGVNARIEALPGSADDHHSEMKGRAEAGGGGVDVFNLDVTWVAEFADAGWIRPLPESDVDTEGFIQAVLDACRYGGRLWALPFNTDAGLLYYRTDLLGPGLPPQRWAEMTTEIDRAFAEGKDQRVVAGYIGQLADYEGLTVNALEAIWEAGGEVVQGGEVVVDSERYREQVQTGLARLAKEETRGRRPVIHPAAAGSREADTTQAFRDGTVVFMRNWPVAYRNLRPVNGEPTDRAVDFDVTRFKGPSVLGGQNLALAARSDQPRAARALIEFLTSARSQQILFERGGFAATHTVVYSDEVVQRVYPYAIALLGAVEGARPRPVTPHYALFSKVFREGVRYAIDHSGRLPDGFADRLRAALDGRLLAAG